jgi:hypothetical protein
MGASVRDDVAIAGLDKAHIDQFEAIGFERTKVVHPPWIVIFKPGGFSTHKSCLV